MRPHKMCKQLLTCAHFKLQENLASKSTMGSAGEESGNLVDMICPAAVTGPTKQKPIVLSHHVFSDDKGWLQRRSLPQPTVTITASVCNDDYIHVGTSLRSTPRGGEVSAVADTGCQSCLIGSKVVHYLGFRDRDLLGVEHRMNAVNQHSIDISGAVILRLTGIDKGGQQLQTTQICYVTPDTDKLYLSREACVDLGLISSSFPTFGEALSVTAVDTHVRMCHAL